MQRRLTTILAADIVGFSRLVGADEEGVLGLRRVHRDEIFAPLLERHGGRVANTAGDSWLIEFSSTVEALRFAIEAQTKVEAMNAEMSEDTRVRYRVGINLGDVVAEGEDLLGDGVNIAARLEALAPPGGIFIARSVRDQVRDRLDVELHDLGQIEVKNIARPVRMFQVLADGKAPIVIAKRKRSLRPIVFTLIAILAVGISYLAWDRFSTEAPIETSLVLPDKPSIAVLPFQDLSQNNPHEWFGDGMAEDIITDLSKLSSLFVISRNSSFQFRGGDHDLRQVGQELGVAYLLEGSVRREGDTLRINAQLIDATTGGHLWADRYDGNAIDVFALQDRVTEHVVNSLALALSPAETERLTVPKTVNLAAHDAYLQGLNHLHRRAPEDFAEAKRWLDKALELDPTYAEALGARANLYMEASQRGWHGAVGIQRGSDVTAALQAALEHPSALAFATETEILITKPDVTRAHQAVERGLALDPNDIDLQLMSARVQAALGNHDLAISLVEQAIRLDPLNPDNYQYELGRMKFIAGDLQGAISALDRAQTHNPSDFFVQIVRAPILVELGRAEEAVADLSLAREHWWQNIKFRPTASNFAWLWGREIGHAYVQRLTQAYLEAGAPVVPDGYHLQPENRMSKKEISEMIGDGKRFAGKCCADNDWITDITAEGFLQDYFAGSLIGTSTHIINADGSTVKQRHDPMKNNQYCESYRNPLGSNETLNAFIDVCTNGTFPFGIFPLPQ